MAKPTTYVTPSETMTAARALLAVVISEGDHVQADAAEAAGDAVTASVIRDDAAHYGDSHREFEIDSIHVPPTLRGVSTWMLLVETYANEDHNSVCGHDCFGVDMSAVTEEVFGSDIVEWCTVRRAPYRTQQALAMMMIAEIRTRRAASRVYAGLRSVGVAA